MSNTFCIIAVPHALSLRLQTDNGARYGRTVGPKLGLETFQMHADHVHTCAWLPGLTYCSDGQAVGFNELQAILGPVPWARDLAFFVLLYPL